MRQPVLRLCDYSDAFILVTGDIKLVHQFLHVRQINGVFVDEANHIYIGIPKYDLTEYSDNYSD